MGWLEQHLFEKLPLIAYVPMNSLLNLPNVLVHSFVKQVEPVEVCLGSVCLRLWTRGCVCVWGL